MTPEIRELAKKFPEETEESVKNLVGLWQEKRHKSPDTYPSELALKRFIKEIRNPAKGNQAAKSILKEKPTVKLTREQEHKDNPVTGGGTQQVKGEGTTNSTSPVNTSFQTIPLVSLQARRKVNLLFDAQTKRSRVTLLSRLFSVFVNKELAKQKEILEKRIEAEKDDKKKVQLVNDLNSLDRLTIINRLTPGGVFNLVYKDLHSYALMSEEERTQEEFQALNANISYEDYSQEEKWESAKKRAKRKGIEFHKITDDLEVFRALAEEASTMLKTTEGITVDIMGKTVEKADLSEDNADGENALNDEVDVYSKEESAKDGWMTKAREVSSFSRLSGRVRKTISEIPRTDAEGYVEEDDLWYPIYLDANYVHATLMDKLRFMTSPSQLLPMLRDLQRTKSWVSEIIALLERDETLFSQFYQNFRMDFLNYWAQVRERKADGSFKIKTVNLNKPEGTYYLLDSWRDNYEAGIQLDKDSIYGKDGKISVENAKKGWKVLGELYDLLQNKDIEEEIEILQDEENFNKVIKLLRMVGVDTTPDIVMDAITHDDPAKRKVEGETPLDTMLGGVEVILNGIIKGRDEIAQEEKAVRPGDEAPRGKDLINTYGTAYNNIARSINDVTEDAIESGVTEGIDGKTKSMYAHSVPNYLGKLIIQLKNVSKDREAYKEFLQREFKQFPFFFKNGKWLNDWLGQLESSEAMRNMLDHKVLLHSDHTSYSNWDSLEYMTVLVNEFFANDSNKGEEHFAWYHVPVMADAPSAEFIKFRRYKDGDVTKDGKELSFEDAIIDRLSNLVIQEYNRIMEVRQRDIDFQNGTSKFEPVANFDIKRDIKGNITSIGGAEFKFLPVLNTTHMQDGELFLDRLERTINSGSGKDVETLLHNTLEIVMEREFEKEWKRYHEIGLLEEDANGNFLYLPLNYGRSGDNVKALRAMLEAKELLGSSWTLDMEELMMAFRNGTPYNTREASSTKETIKELLDNMVSQGTIAQKKADGIARFIHAEESGKRLLKEYFYNSTLATSQIIQLMTTDLAYYKDMQDFFKRFKEIHSPAMRLNTLATFHGERVGRETERTIYLEDDEIVSSVLSDIEEVVRDRHSRGELSDYDAAYMLASYGYSNHEVTHKNGKKTKYAKVGDVLVPTSKVNVADAQAYRSLSSYRAMMVMSGEWTDEMEEAYNNLKSGNWSAKDFNIMWQPKKPFVYTTTKKIIGYNKREVPMVDPNTGRQVIDKQGNPVMKEEDDPSNPIYSRVPVQHKNSEFLLLAIYDTISNPGSKSGKLRAINKFMEDNQIDVVQFESAVKVGKQGVIPLNDVNTEEEVLKRLGEATGISYGNPNPDVVHEISYEDYGIQMATPEHIIDTVQLKGTQMSKLIGEGISEDAVIEVAGKKWTKKEWINWYNTINTENVLQAFMAVDREFSDPKKLERYLRETIMSNQRYSHDLLEACTLDENGNFNIPLYDPVQTQRVQELLNSLIRTRITQQKTKGGALIQASSYGLSDKLKIVFEGKGKHKRIKYMECLMPAYSKEFLEPLMDPKTHTLNIDKLPPDLRKAIGYRIPTEAHYSMAPLYIKGFLPQQSGSAIMLPAEITKISGSNFAIDKLYIILPEFDVRKTYDMGSAWSDFYNDPSNSDIVSEIDRNIGEAFKDYQERHPDDDLDIEDYLEFIKDQGVKRYQFSETAQDRFRKWFKPRREEYLTDTKFRRVNYDFNKSPKENGLRARNNLLLDMMWGVLTNEGTTTRILTPGGFNEPKRVARINDILNNTTEEDLRTALKSVGIQLNQTIQVRNGIRYKPVSSYLFDLDLETLETIAERIGVSSNPLYPSTQITMHQRNMIGAALIGIYALNNPSHALIENTQLELSPTNGAFVLNGKKLTSLHSIKNPEGEYISKTIAGFVAASVDNAKDPVLDSLNQNSYTADVTMLLARAGYTTLEIGLLMNQPIVKDFVRACPKERKKGKNMGSILKEILSEYQKLAEINLDLTYDNYKENRFLVSELADNILISKEATTDRESTDDFRKLEYYKKQVAVGYLFSRLLKDADALKQVTLSMRFDTGKAGAGPTIAHTENKRQTVTDLLNAYYNEEDFPLVGADVIQEGILDDYEDIGDNVEDILRDRILSSPIPYMQAYYTLGVEASQVLMGRYFPQFSDSFRDVVDGIRAFTKTGRLNVPTINNIYNELMAYIMTKTDFFGAEQHTDPEGNIVNVTSYQKRKDFITNFPKYFKEVTSNNPDIANLEFIQRLKVKRANRYNPVDFLVFKNVGHLSSIQRENFTRDWETLLYMDNPKAQELALNLFRYSFYRNGFAFGPNTFIHLAPAILRKLIPGYMETLRNIMTPGANYEEFILQYIYNHLDNRKLVPEIPEKSSISFTDEKGNPKTSISFAIDKSSNSFAMGIIKEWIIDEKPYPVFFDFIGKRIGGKMVYYRKENVGTPDVTTYHKIIPLGFRNSFIEYEFGKDAKEIETVIGQTERR